MKLVYLMFKGDIQKPNNSKLLCLISGEGSYIEITRHEWENQGGE